MQSSCFNVSTEQSDVSLLSKDRTNFGASRASTRIVSIASWFLAASLSLAPSMASAGVSTDNNNAGTNGSSSAVVIENSSADNQEMMASATSYWTAERLMNAKPLDLPEVSIRENIDPSAFQQMMDGK